MKFYQFFTVWWPLKIILTFNITKFKVIWKIWEICRRDWFTFSLNFSEFVKEKAIAVFLSDHILQVASKFLLIYKLMSKLKALLAFWGTSFSDKSSFESIFLILGKYFCMPNKNIFWLWWSFVINSSNETFQFWIFIFELHVLFIRKPFFTWASIFL